MCRLFFDKPGSGATPPDGLIRVKITGMYPLFSPRVPQGKVADSEHLDFCLLTFCLTDDGEEGSKNWMKAFPYGGLQLVKESVLPGETDFLVSFGHPHGKSKRMSMGKVLQQVRSGDALSEFEIEYNLPSCRGSSGGCVFHVPVRGHLEDCRPYAAFLHYKGIHTPPDSSEEVQYLSGRGIKLSIIAHKVEEWFASASEKVGIHEEEEPCPVQ